MAVMLRFILGYVKKVPLKEYVNLMIKKKGLIKFDAIRVKSF